MTALTREEENARLAKFVGCEFRLAKLPPDWPKTTIPFWFMPDGTFVGENPPDFFHSEEASALLLEKMPLVNMENRGEEWACSWLTLSSASCSRIRHYYSNPDRKTAIAKAALALIEKESHDH